MFTLSPWCRVTDGSGTYTFLLSQRLRAGRRSAVNLYIEQLFSKLSLVAMAMIFYCRTSMLDTMRCYVSHPDALFGHCVLETACCAISLN
ncbi:hypothetical protein PoB_007049400 [Plakobranchus ocellatus]|uniref:Uncharacterized protein n=1 Tax=Plakobranchus ocellatus TaxID=259542 RepID=A0AAV4DIH6_9GAST|nr:hypothetical protein PoB_007049400 [Plakobranchus ocellatus]